MLRSSSTLPLSASLLIALALPVVCTVVALVPGVATAAPILSEPLVDLVPVDEIIADGHTAAMLNVVVIGTDGSPMTGVTGKVIPTSGTADRLEEVAPGQYRFAFTPPAVDAAAEIELTLRLKASTGGPLVKKATVPVVPALAHSLAITANPAQVILGQDASATLTINLSGGSESTLSGADLAVEASSGTVANVTPLGRGQYSLLFTSPEKKFPHLALITVADRRDPAGTVGAIALPMVGRAPFPVTGVPDSNIVVRVGGKEFGPVQANAQGKATVTLTVPPGVTKGTVISVVGEQRTEADLDLKVPPTPLVQLFPVAPVAAADGRTATTVRAFVAETDGRAAGTAKVVFKPSTGTVSAVRNQGGGIYAVDWTPAVATQAGTATIQVEVLDTGSQQIDTLDVRYLPARPESLALEAVPATIPVEGGTFVVRAQVTGPTPARGVAMSGADASQEATPGDRGNGLFEGSFRSTGRGGAMVQAAVVADASSNPLARVLLIPGAELVPNDGASQIPLTVLTLDAGGYPVGNAPVALSVTQGDAKVAPSVTTDAHGIAQTTLTAGSARELLTLEAASGGHVGSAGILQLPASATAIDLPVGGDTMAQSLHSRWEPLVRGISVPRAGAPVAVAAVVPAATARTLAAGIATLAITPSAATVAPGQTITLVIDAKDAAGVGVAGRTLQIFTNAGTASTAADQGGGRYQTTLTAPASGVDVIRVTVVSPDTGISQMVEVPVGAPAPAWGIAATEPVTQVTPEESTVRETPVMPTTTPVAETAVKVKEPKAPTAPSEHPWLRAQAGFLGGFYSYEQKPTSGTGPLYGQRIAFGGGETPAAGSAGLALKARAWSPGTDYFGAQLDFRTTRYAVELADFNSLVPDWVNEVEALFLTRYPIDAGKTRISPTLRVGAGVSDWMIYRQDTTHPTPVLDYGPLVVPSFNVGPQVDVDVGSALFLSTGATFGFNGGGGLYSTHVDATLGYAFMGHVYVYGNVDWIGRSTQVFIASDTGAKQKAGDLSDALTVFGAGLGTQF